MTTSQQTTKPGTTNFDLKKLTLDRLVDAECLLKGHRYDAAAYLCGYVLETALKACICRRLRLRTYPENELQGKFKTHSFEELALLAGIKDEISAANHPNLKRWSVVAGWKPDRRYQPHGSVPKTDAEDMIEVMKKEVLPWLKRRW